MYDLLKLKNKGMKTPLANARRFGSAHEGLHHWVMQRVTAVSNLLLLIWLIGSSVYLLDKGPQGFYAFLHDPINAMMMAAFLLSATLHMMLGLQVVIEDYIHKTSSKIILMLLLKFTGWGALIVAFFSLAKIVLGNTYVVL